MPHINIKHFSPISGEQKIELVKALTEAIKKTLNCDEAFISIALETIQERDWQEKVYTPEIVDRGYLLCKKPNY